MTEAMLRTVVQTFRRKVETAGDFGLTISRITRDFIGVFPPANAAVGWMLSMLEIARVSDADVTVNVSITDKTIMMFSKSGLQRGTLVNYSFVLKKSSALLLTIRVTKLKRS
jgi:hypothetical protein